MNGPLIEIESALEEGREILAPEPRGLFLGPSVGR